MRFIIFEGIKKLEAENLGKDVQSFGVLKIYGGLNLRVGQNFGGAKFRVLKSLGGL